jgi:hypothetical protein
MTRKLQLHPLTKPSIEKKVERVFKKLNEERSAGNNNKKVIHANPKKR